jgi:hypothetical protein
MAHANFGEEEFADFAVSARFHVRRSDVHAQQRQGATSLCNPSLASELL